MIRFSLLLQHILDIWNERTKHDVLRLIVDFNFDRGKKVEIRYQKN